MYINVLLCIYLVRHLFIDSYIYLFVFSFTFCDVVNTVFLVFFVFVSISAFVCLGFVFSSFEFAGIYVSGNKPNPGLGLVPRR